MPFLTKSKLPRLGRESYQGRAVVFWTHTIEDRATGWLTDTMHRRFREVMVHAGARFQLACPVYVLMPDHWHLVWMGLSEESDQRLATAFLREHVAPLLAEAKLQDRPHDHVLREEERRRNAFMAACTYTLENPVRAGLVRAHAAWPFLGALVAGYPDLDPLCAGYWDVFWRIYNRKVGAA